MDPCSRSEALGWVPAACSKALGWIPAPDGSLLPQQSAGMDPCSLTPTDASSSQELTPAWEPRRGASAGDAPALPAGCCPSELGQAAVRGRLSSPLQPRGLTIGGRSPGGGKRLSPQHDGAGGAEDTPCHRAESGRRAGLRAPSF